jgi:hypothetical protein
MRTSLLFSIALLGGLQASAQSTCATALPVAAGQHTVAAVNGTQTTTLNCANGGGAATAAVWYTYTSALDTNVRISSDLAGFPSIDTRVQIYSGACGSLVCVGGDDDSGAGYSSIATFYAMAGVTYTIAWDNYWSSAGFTFEITEFSGPPPPMDIVSFTPMSISLGGSGMAVVDMNGDHLDDVVGVTGTNVNIHKQLSAGGFSSVNIATTPADNTPSWSLAAGDIDGNGYNDLLYGGGSGATFMMANSSGTGFTEVSFPQYIFCQRTNMADLNNDGNLDAFSCHDVDANVAFYNDGSGNLTFSQGGFGTTCGNYGSIFVDYDNDGDLDCFVAKCGCDPVDLLMKNNGDGTFTNVAGPLGLADGHQSWSSAWGDFDNDGDMDILIGSSSSGYHKLMQNNGNGTFTNITTGSGIDSFNGQSIEWTTHDFDNDGYLDIMGAGAILVNNGDMTFTIDNTVPSNGPVGDLNNDGFVDILNGSTIQFNNGNDNNWLKVATVGMVSNSNGIGARITVTTASGSQIREVRSGDGFRYMSSLNAHFGIGTDDQILQVMVRWPSGIVDIIADPAINTTLVVVEGLSTAVTERSTPELSIYPVPATDFITITGARTPNSAVRVLDATGKLVQRSVLTTDRLNVSTLPSGIYVLEVNTPNGTVKRSFAKE